MKNQKTLNRFAAVAAVLLAFCLVFIAPVGAAATTDSTAEGLQNAFNAGGEVTLGTNIEVTETLVVSEDKVVTLDLAGHKITGGLKVGSTTDHIYAINNKGTLTIKDSSNGETGKITSRGIYNYGTLTLESGTIDACDGNGGYAVNNEGSSNFVMNGGTVTASVEDDHQSDSGGYDATPLGVKTGSTATLNGGKITSVTDYTFAISVSGGALTVPETSTIKVSGYHGAIAVSGGTATINAGEFSVPYDGASRTDNVAYVSGTGSLIINGGTFTGDSDTGSGGSCVYDSNGGAEIKGGTFRGSSGGDVWGTTGTTINGGDFGDLTEESHVAVGAIITNGGKTYTMTEGGSLTEVVAKIVETGVTYSSLQDAIDEVTDGATIILLDDVTFTTGAGGSKNGISYTRDVSFIMDLNEKTITSNLGNNALRFKIGDGNEVTNTEVTITIKNGKVVSGSDNWCAISAATADDSGNKLILNLEGLEVEANRAGDYAVKSWAGAVINANDVNVVGNYAGGFYAIGGEVVLDDCAVVQKGMHTEPYMSMAVGAAGEGKMIVNSGTYTTECLTAEEGDNQGTSHGPWAAGVCNSGGTLIINGGTFTNKNFGEATQATYARGLILADTGANIDINGGTFNALKSIIDVTNNLGDASNNPSVTLSGGAFSADPRISGLYASELITVEENYVCVGPTDGKYTVEEANPEITVTPTDGVSSTLEVGYEQPEPQIITVKNDGNVELTLAITKTGFENITITGLPESKLLATSESFSFTVQLDAGLAAGTYSGTITLSNESIENKVIPVSFTVSDPTSDEGAPGTTSPGSGSSSGKDTGSGNFQYYPRSVPADGIIDFGTSPVVTGMEVPVGSSGTVSLNTKPTFAMPENGFYIFEIDAPGYNTEAKINGGIAFKISIAKIEEAGWTENDVVLFHGTVAEDGKITWEALPTNLVKVENGIAYYKAAINGCSPFYIGFVEEGSIVNTEVVDPVTPPTEEPDVPGTDLPDIPGVQDEPEEPSSPAPVLGLLAALGAAVALRRK